MQTETTNPYVKWNNTVIKVLNEEHRKKVIDFWEKEGIFFEFDPYNSTNKYIGVINREGDACGVDDYNSKKLKIIELPKEKLYPKVMLVWDTDESIAVPRVVFMEKNGKYISWFSAKTLEDADKVYATSDWNYAKDLPEEPKKEIIELTLEDIASKYGVDVNNIKIKK